MVQGMKQQVLKEIHDMRTDIEKIDCSIVEEKIFESLRMLRAQISRITNMMNTLENCHQIELMEIKSSCERMKNELDAIH